MKTLNLLFPQWQGAGRVDLYAGAQLLCRELEGSLSLLRVPTSLTYSLAVTNSILSYSQILSQLVKVHDLIQTDDPGRIFTVGGDCGVELAPISFLNRKYQQPLGVVWLDAHGDLNTPRSSPSGHFHGMPLRVLLGDGDAGMVKHTFSTLRPDQVFLVGAREFDPPEAEFVQAQGLSITPTQAINTEDFSSLYSKLSQRGCEKIYIHLDLDVLDPEEFPHVACPTPGGIGLEPLASLLADLGSRYDVVGLSVLEFLPVAPQDQAAATVVRLLERAKVLSWAG